MGLREDAAAVDDADAAATLLSLQAQNARVQPTVTSPRPLLPGERHSPQNVRPTLTSPRRLLPGGEVLSLRERRLVRRLAELRAPRRANAASSHQPSVPRCTADL